MNRAAETLKRFRPRLLSALLLLAAAWALHRAMALSWGGAEAPDGTRYKVSPVGITHVLEPRQTVSPYVWAGWSPPSGDAALGAVAPGGQWAYGGLRLIHPTLQAACGLSLLGGLAVLVPLSPRWRRGLAVVLPAGAALLTLMAVVLFIFIPPRALAVLAPLEFGYGGTLGFMLVSFAPLLCGGATILAPIGFSLVVWYPILLFLLPLAGLLLLAAVRWGTEAYPVAIDALAPNR